MTKLAVFFETEEIAEGSPQYLLMPIDGTVKMFSRISDGGKKGTNVWTPTETFPVGETLTREPSSVVVTEKDESLYRSLHKVSVLGTKALNAHEDAPITMTVTTDDLAALNLIEMVKSGDEHLNTWIRDGRRVNPVNTGSVEDFEAAEPIEATYVTQDLHAEDFKSEEITKREENFVHSMARVPDASVATKYVHREIYGVHDFDVFDWAFANDKNVLLYGPTGPGKTTSAVAFAAHKKLPVFMVSGTVSLEASQLFGRYIPDGAGSFMWQDGGVTELVRHGGVLILDEVNFIPSKIATVLFSLLAGTTRSITLLDHKGETIQAHPDLFIVATMNPFYAGTQEMNAAFRNRYSLQIEWGYDEKVEKQLVSSKRLLKVAQDIRNREAAGDIMTPTPTNALIDFIEVAGALGLEFAIQNFVARYSDDEAAAVKMVFDAEKSNLEKDMKVATKTIVVDSEETKASKKVDATSALADALASK